MPEKGYFQILFLLAFFATRLFALSTVMKHKKDVLVLLDPVTEWKPVLEAALRLDYAVIAVQLSPIVSESMAKFHPTESVLKAAGAFGLLNRQDRDVFACVQALQLVLQQHPEEFHTIRAVIPLSETAVDFSDTIAACLGLTNHNPLHSILCRRDKGFMKQAVAKAGLPVPKFARLFHSQELQPALESLQLDYPIVIKTPQGFSTTDVFVCPTPDQAHTALDTILSHKGPDGRTPLGALLEEYIGGTEFAVNLLATTTSTTGLLPLLLVTDVWKYDKTNTARYNRAILCHPQDFPELCAYAQRVAQAVGIHYGAAHVELKAASSSLVTTTNGSDSCYTNPILMEVGARLSGGRKATMIHAAYDQPQQQQQSVFDPFEALIQSHTGTLGRTEMPAYPPLHVQHLFLPVERAGRIRKVHSLLLDDKGAFQTVHSQFWLVREGDCVKETTDITSCAGFVWLVGAKELVEQEATAIRDSFRLEMDED